MSASRIEKISASGSVEPAIFAKRREPPNATFDMPKGTPSSPDFNHDGHVSRSEAKKAKFKVQAADTNDDGRITRSEAKKMKELKLGPVKFESLE